MALGLQGKSLAPELQGSTWYAKRNGPMIATLARSLPQNQYSKPTAPARPRVAIRLPFSRGTKGEGSETRTQSGMERHGTLQIWPLGPSNP